MLNSTVNKHKLFITGIVTTELTLEGCIEDRYYLSKSLPKNENLYKTKPKTSSKQKCFYKSSQILVRYAFKANNNPTILKI